MSRQMMHVERLLPINTAATKVYNKFVAGTPSLGRKNGNERLTDDQVILARALYYLKNMPYKDIVKVLNIECTYGQICSAVSRRSYRSVVAPFEKPRMSRGKIVWDINTSYDFDFGVVNE